MCEKNNNNLLNNFPIDLAKFVDTEKKKNKTMILIWNQKLS